MNPVIRNIFWLLAEHGSRIILSTLSVSLMARALGVEQYGLLQYTLGLVAAFSSISFICGAEVLVPPLVTATPAERKRLLDNAFVLRQAASIVAYICLLLFAWAAEDRSNFLLITLMGITILLNESFAVVTAWLQSQTDMKPRAVLSIFSLTFRLAIAAILYYSGVQNIYFYALFYLLDSVIVAVSLFFIYKNKNEGIHFQYDLKYIVDLLKKGLPFWAALILMNIQARIDIIMLKHYSDRYNLGIYSAALQLLNLITILASIINTSLAPRYVYGQDDKKKAHKNTGVISMAMFLLAILLALMARILSTPVLHLLFGEKFNGSAPLFNKMIWTVCLIFLDSSLSLYLIRENKSKSIIVKYFLSLVVSCSAHFYFIPIYQADGAILGYTTGWLSACLISIYFFVKNKPEASDTCNLIK